MSSPLKCYCSICRNEMTDINFNQSEKIMTVHEVWAEGYRASGDSAGARLLGYVDAETFAEACDKLCSPSEWQKLNGGYDPQRKTVWGCRLFNNYADACQSFG